MHNSSNIMNQNSKNPNIPLDSSLFINCTFDTDYLEVTKTESLRKYEENIYLLGSIFSNKNDKEITEENNDSDNENDESLDEDIINLFNDNNNKNFENDIEKINNIIKNTDIESEQEKVLMGQLLTSLEDYKDTLNFVKSTKENYSNELKEYNDLNQKLRTSKNIDGEIDDLRNKADQFGILPNTFKQHENFLRKKRDHKLNTDVPFSNNDNFVVMNL